MSKIMFPAVRSGDPVVCDLHKPRPVPVAALCSPAERGDALSRKESALCILGRESAPLFAVLDAARDGRVLALLRESVDEFQSLYDGHAAELLEEVAPYLARLPRGSRLLARLVHEGWGDSLGVYLTSARPFKDVRAHLQRLLAASAGGERRRIYFRYYDPRVLRAFLPACDPRRAADLFASTIEKFLVEGPQGEVLQFRRPTPSDA